MDLGERPMKVVSSGKKVFKRDSAGKTRVWWADIGTDESLWAWRTNSGIEDGKIVTSGWKTVEQKNVGRANETTLKEQAFFEVDAELKKKLDRGYFTDVSDIDTFEKIKPMLAIKHEDAKYNFDNSTYFTQPKLDGIRCIARRDGLWSRAGKEIVAVPHVMEALRVFFEKFPDAILDGELYNHQLRDDFNTITSLVRKTKPTEDDLKESSRLVQYHVYDVVEMPLVGDLDPSNISFEYRYQWLYDLGFGGESSIQIVDTRSISSLEEMDSRYGEYLEAGYEGQMIRINTAYEKNKRSKSLIKRKEFLTDEFEVVGVEEGKGNWAGYIKRFVLRLPDGREFGAGVRGTQEVMKKLFESGEKPNWATLRYFTPTPDGVPRFPVVVDWGIGSRED
jgi:DNA ligase 1